MQLQQNTDRIQTTHIGSLPRPHRLLDAMKAKYSGQTYDEKAYQDALRDAVADVRARTGRSAASTSSPTGNSPSPGSSPMCASGSTASNRARS